MAVQTLVQEHSLHTQRSAGRVRARAAPVEALPKRTVAAATERIVAAMMEGALVVEVLLTTVVVQTCCRAEVLTRL